MEVKKNNKLLKDLENFETGNSNDVTEAGNLSFDTDQYDEFLYDRDEPDFFQDYIKFANKMIYQDIPQTTLT